MSSARAGRPRRAGGRGRRRYACLADEHGVRIDVEGEPATVPADRMRVEQVVTNLVDNAVKHSGAGETVRITTWRRDGEAGLTVTDDGLGIPGDLQPRVFERFFRADAARTSTGGGAGLGLAICREIIEAHGGRVWMESTEGLGSSFSLALPLSP